MKKVELYTDGACRGNPGLGGYGVLIRYGEKEKTLKGASEYTTNNQMELQAAIEGLRALKETCEVDLYTDSKYVKDGMTSWMYGWKQKNWKTANKKPVKNQALWQELDKLTQIHRVRWHWVKGHSNHPENDQADLLANQAIDEFLSKRKS